MSSPEVHPAPPPRQGSGGKCLLGCGIIVLIAIVCCAGIGWYVYSNWLGWAAGALRDPIVETIQESELREEDKKAIIEQVDRVVAETKAGRVDMKKLGQITKNITESPLLQISLVYFVKEQYVRPSGLSQEEKEQAQRTLDRVARGVFEKKIDPDRLESAVDMISETKPDGKRELKKQISDDELRGFLTELKMIADSADIPDEPFEVNIGQEIKKAVDKALNE